MAMQLFHVAAVLMSIVDHGISLDDDDVVCSVENTRHQPRQSNDTKINIVSLLSPCTAAS